MPGCSKQFQHLQQLAIKRVTSRLCSADNHAQRPSRDNQAATTMEQLLDAQQRLPTWLFRQLLLASAKSADQLRPRLIFGGVVGTHASAAAERMRKCASAAQEVVASLVAEVQQAAVEAAAAAGQAHSQEGAAAAAAAVAGQEQEVAAAVDRGEEVEHLG